MEMAQAGVKTRARASTLAIAASTPSKKRRKITIDENLNFSSPSSCAQLKAPSSSAAAPSPEQRCFDESPASCCSSNGSFELDENRNIKFSDLEVESASTCNSGEEIRREMSLLSELRTNSQEVESVEKKPATTKIKSRCVLSTPQRIMPTESELEEFFNSAEKDIQKQFSDKYNYDTVRDVPLEGRYQWIQLKP